jgi:transposase
MSEIIKYSIGVEVSKDNLEIRFGSIDTEQKTKISESKKFANTEKGIQELYKYTQSLIKEDKPAYYIMEATGIYFENLGYYLKEQGAKVAIILPNKSKHYRQSLDMKGKSDEIDSKALTQLGLERNLKEWELPAEIVRKLKVLTREYETITDLNTQFKNQLHAKLFSDRGADTTIKRIQENIDRFNKQLKEIENEIRKILKKDDEINQKVEMIEESLKGVGFLTIVKIIAEANLFTLINNKNQLVSYAGLDVIEDSSGQRQGKTKISSKGNSHIRKALYMPALSVVKYVTEMKDLYIRLCEKQKAKKVGLTAVMRKLLILIYTLWKKNERYDPCYAKK